MARDLAAVRQSVKGLSARQEQVSQRDIAAVQQRLEQLAAKQEQMAGDIVKLQMTEKDIQNRLSTPRPRPAATPERRPLQSQRAPP